MTTIRHWSEVLAKEVADKKREPFIIASGITTSGPCHIGTACEFLYPSALVEYLKDEGHKAEFIFVGDLMDAFDSIPEPLKEFTYLKEWFGRPLYAVPDPYECCDSYGDHYLNEVVDLMRRFGISATILKTNELVESGKYDPYFHVFYKKRSLVKEIARKTAEMSGVPGLPDWVDIAMPTCENCGRIATTVVEALDEDFIRYSDTKDAKYTKGCGYEGKMKITEHRYKLFWRLDWPSRQDFLNVSAELAGIDHHTRGGSWDTAVAVHREVFGKEPPIGHRYGFVLLRGKKYSKSKGIGLDVQELLELVPPELIKYRLFRPDIEENKNFDPSGHALMKLYEEYDEAANLYEKGVELRRAENKIVLAYSLATEKRRWRADFADILTNYQVYKNWNKVSERVGDREGVEYLRRYVENWITRGYLPEEYVFQLKPTKIDGFNEELAIFASRLNQSMKDEDIHELVYNVAKERGMKPPQLFKALYLSLIGKEYGPRLGRLIVAIGVMKTKESLSELYT